MRTSFFVAFIVLSLILLPVLTFLYLIFVRYSLNSVLNTILALDSNWFFVLLSTFTQASLSAFISVALGILGGMGLLGLRAFLLPTNTYNQQASPFNKAPNTKRFKLSLFGFIELFCILPALFPPLVAVLAWINVSELFFRFPFSFVSVLFVHVLMNVGMTSVFFYRLFVAEAGALSAYAFLHGISCYRFLKRMLCFELKKDVLLIFLLVFSFCFMSFSVPLLVGGLSGQTLEVLISEQIKDPATWPVAGFLFFIEALFIFIFFSLLYRQVGKNSPPKSALPTDKVYLLNIWGFCFFAILPSLLIILGLCIGGMGFLFSENIKLDLMLIKAHVTIAWLKTLFVGLGTGFLILLLLSMVAFASNALFLRRFLVAYTGACTAFMGFTFLLIGGDNAWQVGFKWCVGLSLLFLPALYRLMGEARLFRLENQVKLAQLMGAKPFLTFKKIVWPQSAPVFYFLSGVGAFWAVGDFAYSSMVTYSQGHLALLIQDLFASYKFELATVLTGLLLATGVFCFWFFAIGLPKVFSLWREKKVLSV